MQVSIQENKKIGISITTRNRSEMLDYCLKHFHCFPSFYDFVIVVSDDQSYPDQAAANKEICEFYGVKYIYNPERLGIAKNKNVTIDYLTEVGYDYLFLFDDDCFPQRQNWELPFIEIEQTYNIQHSMYLIGVGELHQINRYPLLEEYDNCSGFCLFFTRHAMGLLKGMNPDFGIYGFEHAEMSNRAHKLGLTSEHGKYLCPSIAKKFLFSYDMDKGWLNKESPLGPFNAAFSSSIEDERPLINDYIEHNRKVFTSL